MSLNSEYKHNKRLTIGFNKTQYDSLKKLEAMGINISQFVRLAIREKIKKDYKKIKENTQKKKCPF